MGVKSGSGIDKTPYPGHEDLSWHMTGFQRGSQRSACTGRIFKTDSIFYPLMCECATAISSLASSSLFGGGGCAKFLPNEKGQERIIIAESIAKEREIELSEVLPEELPPPDPDYEAAMMY